jgi:predicted TIM-barrel fold metal-dependent hydrolase
MRGSAVSPIQSRPCCRGPAWGWHVETGTHLLRLVVGGVFDRQPHLQVVVGHMGELVPFMIPRFAEILSPVITGLEHPVRHYLNENVSYTFAGFNWQPLFDLLRSQVDIERILFSVDHPFADMAKSVRFLHDLDVTAEERAAIAHGNAERLFPRGLPEMKSDG